MIKRLLNHVSEECCRRIAVKISALCVPLEQLLSDPGSLRKHSTGERWSGLLMYECHLSQSTCSTDFKLDQREYKKRIQDASRKRMKDRNELELSVAAHTRLLQS